MSKVEGKKKWILLILLQLVIMIYTLSGVAAKFAAGYEFYPVLRSRNLRPWIVCHLLAADYQKGRFVGSICKQEHCDSMVYDLGNTDFWRTYFGTEYYWCPSGNCRHHDCE